MFYIPTEWIKDKKNEPMIHKILNENLYTDLNVDDSIGLVIEKLNEIEETTIIEKIEDGTIKIN